MTTQFMVISYDISNDRRRRKIMETLEDFGRRVQYSVFECRITQSDFIRLKKRLKPQVRDVEDSVRIYFIGAEDVGRIQIIGSGKVTEERTFFFQ